MVQFVNGIRKLDSLALKWFGFGMGSINQPLNLVFRWSNYLKTKQEKVRNVEQTIWKLNSKKSGFWMNPDYRCPVFEFALCNTIFVRISRSG